ncbi:MAG: hypothetical protein J0M37_11355 [Ignavibacteria bacterium]|nr:hypothetical protein [Ignavibacteria bacterium]
MNISDYLNKANLDIRKVKGVRFMDQKVTPDVLCIISDCVINYVGDDLETTFTKNDIWESQYFIKNVKNIFNKPDALKETARSEYDKFVSQPLQMLSFAQLLYCEKRGTTNFYKIKNQELLEYISLKEHNAYVFLYFYLLKVMESSGFLKNLINFKTLYENGNLTEEKFQDLKDQFKKFILGNTNINGKTEVYRIFPKVLNVFSAYNYIPGAIKGRLSKFPFCYGDLMYNRVNWRDRNKSKDITRQEAESLFAERVTDLGTSYNAYLVQKAMNTIRKLYRESEIKDQWSSGDATQVHHIFSSKSFPSLAHYLENLIKLTPTQHFFKAHPNNKTTVINRDYQLICLLAKSNSIETSLKAFGERYYRKESFIYVINTGLSLSLNASLSFNDIRVNLVQHYNKN